MPHTVVFLWISAASVGPGFSVFTGAGARLDDLRDFGAAHGLSFTPLPAGAAREQGRPLGLPPHDADRVDTLEAELEQARTALSALEEEAATERLASVEAELRAHPHLPQAAFLMAECLALQAQATRATDSEKAKRLDTRRAALEGPRALAFGDTIPPATASGTPPATASGTPPATASGTPPATASDTPAAAADIAVPFRLEGLARGDTLELDGIERRPPELLLPGLHHARVLRAGRPIFATFFEVGSAAGHVALPVPQLTPCNADDLAGVRLQGKMLARAATSDVACAAWAIVREEPTGIAVALCERDRCSAFVSWRKRPAQPFLPLSPPERSALPAWAGFTIAGAATLLTTSILLWQAGALDRSSKSAPTWQFGGLKPQGLRF